MSFAVPKRKKSNGPSTSRCNPTLQTQQSLTVTSTFFNNLFQQGFGNRGMQTSCSSQQLNEWTGGIGTIQLEQESPHSQFQATTTQNMAFEQGINNKVQKLLDRMGFIEDALSRVELQQDSIRPVLKMLENNKTSSSNQNNRSGNKKSQTIYKENSNSSSSFINMNNGAGLLLEKLTKSSAQLHLNQNSHSEVSQNITNNNLKANCDVSQNELQNKCTQFSESMIQQKLTIDEILLQLDLFKLELGNQASQISQLYQQNINNSSSTSSQKQQKIVPTTSMGIQEDFILSIKEESLELKNQMNCLKAKVDSMDNSYDKRISNLEAVITPLLAQQMTQKSSLISEEIVGNIFLKVQQMIDDKLSKLQPQKMELLEIKSMESPQSVKKEALSINSENQKFKTQSSAHKTSNNSSQNHSLSNSKQQQHNSNPTPQTSQVLTQQNQNIMSDQLSQQVKQNQSQILKKIGIQNIDTKDLLEDLEQFILTTSETINEKLEDIQRQMGDLNSEIKANIELVKEKKKINSTDTNQFIKVLGEDVKQFISCMREELEQVVGAIRERDDKCSTDMEKIENRVHDSTQLKKSLSQNESEGGLYEMTIQDKKELQKVDAFKEHSLALQRHMENTSNYLSKEVQCVESKIEDAKQVILKELGLNLYKEDDYLEEMNLREKKNIEKEIREIEEEEEEESEDDNSQEDFGNIDEASLTQQETSNAEQIIEMDSEDEESQVYQQTFTNKHLMTEAPKANYKQEVLISQQSSTSSENIMLSAKQLNKSSQNISQKSNSYQQQPFYYSNSKTLQTPSSYNIEVFVSNRSEEGGVDQQQAEFDNERELDLISNDEISKNQSRSISTVNDEAEPHRAQKSPQNSGTGGKKFYGKHSQQQSYNQ